MITLRYAIPIKDALGWELYKENLRVTLIDAAVDNLADKNKKYSPIRRRSNET